jgi:hypothetical protein
MSTLNKLAIVGLTTIGAALIVTGSTVRASAEEIRGTCNGTVTIADNYRSPVGHEGNHNFQPGDRDTIAVRLSTLGNIRWFCNSTTEGLVANKDECGLEGGLVTVAVRVRNDGGVRITCA